ncbi:MAG: DUF4293 domain-containing protein [Bacteroidales bacterium]|nr:DUF4293 domain-containing protein [Bacteroidales bacterium]
MIQRIQTLFLILAIVANVLLFLYPVLSITEFTEVKNEQLETDYYELSAAGIADPSPDSKPHLSNIVVYPLAILTSLIIILVAYSISRYKNRLHQIKLNKVSVLLNVILIAAVFLNYPKLLTDFSIEMNLEMGAYFLLVSLVMLIVANNFIMKDEKLVRSMNRLR